MTDAAATSRRTVLLAGLGAAGLAALAGCGRPPAAVPPVPPSGGPSGSPYVGGLRVAALGAALENLLVAGYDGALAGAVAGRYGAVPGAVEAVARTARDHHARHAHAWNSLLAGAGRPPVTGAPLADAAALLAPGRAAGSVADVLRAMLGLERLAAATAVAAVAAVTDPAALRAAATIAPVEAQHGAVLALLLGQDPVPATTLSTDGALRPTDLTA